MNWELSLQAKLDELRTDDFEIFRGVAIRIAEVEIELPSLDFRKARSCVGCVNASPLAGRGVGEILIDGFETTRDCIKVRFCIVESGTWDDIYRSMYAKVSVYPEAEFRGLTGPVMTSPCPSRVGP